MVQQLLLWGAGPYRKHQGRTAREVATIAGHAEVVKMLLAWRPIQALWVVCSVGEVRHVAPRSGFNRFPNDLCPMLGTFLM
jgi:hypothetical protein